MTRRCVHALLLAFSLCFTGPIFAKEQSVRPGINVPFENPTFEEWVERFEHEGRDVYDKREQIVDATGVQPGMVVADIGAGTGLFTRLFAPRVNSTGMVIAVDISKTFIQNILRTTREQNLKNVQGVVSTPTDVSLARESVDIAFVCDTYHHFEYPQSMLATIHRALKPSGTLVVIDFERIEGVSSSWVMGHVRGDKQTTIAEIEAAGFQLIEDRPLLKENYFLRFAKKVAAQ
jgi:ubiquinone/menaquinone biosynthesis C-methylase UbiE